MYFITTKRMLEVCFSAHPNIQYRTTFNKYMPCHGTSHIRILHIICDSVIPPLCYYMHGTTRKFLYIWL